MHSRSKSILMWPAPQWQSQPNHNFQANQRSGQVGVQVLELFHTHHSSTHIFDEGGENTVHLPNAPQQCVHTASCGQGCLYQLMVSGQQSPQLQNDCLLKFVCLVQCLRVLFYQKRKNLVQAIYPNMNKHPEGGRKS